MNYRDNQYVFKVKVGIYLLLLYCINKLIIEFLDLYLFMESEKLLLW